MNYHLLYGCGLFLCAVGYALQMYENRKLKASLRAENEAIVMLLVAAGANISLMEGQSNAQVPPTH